MRRCKCTALSAFVADAPPRGADFETLPTLLLGVLQSLMFLLDADAFSATFEEAPTDSAAGYDRYVEIVNNYVRERSPFEVNIESKTRNAILRATDRKTFIEVTLVRQPKINAVRVWCLESARSWDLVRLRILFDYPSQGSGIEVQTH